MKKFFRKALVVISIIMMSMTGCSNSEQIDYDSRLLESGEQAIIDFGVIPNRTFDVTLEDGIYTANINGDIQKVQLPTKNDSKKLSVTEIEKTNRKTDKIAQKALEKVLEYVKASKTLKEKQHILEELKKIDIKTACVDAPAMYEDGNIYIGKDYLDVVCEWMIVHEYIHGLAAITNGGVENERYAYYQFDEAMTDIITYTLTPEILDGYQSGYVQYYDTIVLYVGCFGEKAILAYFYGYDEIIDITGEVELDFFVNSFENMYDSEVAMVCVYNGINKWAQMDT